MSALLHKILEEVRQIKSKVQSLESNSSEKVYKLEQTIKHDQDLISKYRYREDDLKRVISNHETVIYNTKIQVDSLFEQLHKAKEAMWGVTMYLAHLQISNRIYNSQDDREWCNRVIKAANLIGPNKV